MAKLKVHELAKELNIQSKEVLTYLQGAGVEVKAAQSSLEDDIVNKVRGKFAGGGDKKNEEKENKSQGITGEKLEEHDNEIHKKKKNIIFVSNPYNSKIAGTNSQKPQTQSNSNNQKGSSTSSGSSNNQYKPANNQQVVNRPLIKPTTPPSQPTASNIIRGSQTASAPVSTTAKTTNEVAKETNVVQPKIEQPIEKQVVIEKAMETVVAKSEDQKTAATEPVKHTETSAPARSHGNNFQGNNSNYQGQRPQGTGYQGTNSNYQGQRPQGTGYQGTNSNYQGQRPQGTGYQGTNSNYQGQRPQGTGYQGNNSNYQGQRPQGTGYQGNNSNYQGQRPQGTGYQGNNSNYQGQRPQGTGYQGTNSNYQGQRPQGTGYQGNNSNYQGSNSNYQGQRPQGTGYQGNSSNYQGQRPQGTGYQGNSSNYQGQRPQGTGYQGNNTGGYQGRNAGTGSAPGQNRTYGQKPYTQGAGSFQRGGAAFGGNKDKDDDVKENRFAKKTPVKSDGPSMGIDKHRDDEKRRISQEKDKRNKKDLVYEEEVSALNKNKAGRFIKPEKKQEATEEQIKVIVISELLTIKELAEKMKLQPSAIVKKLFLKGQIVTVNQEISYEDAENIAIEYDIICEKRSKN
jgi:translation initiation factor IF-2